MGCCCAPATIAFGSEELWTTAPSHGLRDNHHTVRYHKWRFPLRVSRFSGFSIPKCELVDNARRQAVRLKRPCALFAVVNLAAGFKPALITLNVLLCHTSASSTRLDELPRPHYFLSSHSLQHCFGGFPILGNRAEPARCCSCMISNTTVDEYAVSVHRSCLLFRACVLSFVFVFGFVLVQFHVEAARLLGFTEEEFVKTLDWDSR